MNLSSQNALVISLARSGRKLKNTTLSFSFITQLFFFFLTALHDLKKKTVPLYIFLLAGAAGYILRMIDIFRGTAPQGLELLLPFLPGIFVYLFYRILRGPIGAGDVLFTLVEGFYLTLPELLLLNAIGLMTAFLVSILIMVRCHFRRSSLRRRSIAFIPCLLPGFILITISRLGYI